MNKNIKTKKLIISSLGAISVLITIPIVAISCSDSSKEKSNNSNDTINNLLSSSLESNSKLVLTNLGNNTLPSEINVAKIEDYIFLPKSLIIKGNTINFSFGNTSNFDDEQGSILINLIANTNLGGYSQSKLITVFGFKTISNIKDTETAQKLIENVPNITKIIEEGKNILPSSIQLSNIDNYIQIDNTQLGAKYSIISISSPNNVLGWITINIQLNYKGIILNNEFTLSGFKFMTISDEIPNDLDKLVNSNGAIVNLDTGISTNLSTTGYKQLVEKMFLNRDSQINEKLISTINTNIQKTKEFENIIVSVANGTSNLEGKLVLTINGKYKDQSINNALVTITGFNKSILASSLTSYKYSINNFSLNFENYLNNFQTENSLKQLSSYDQWKNYVSNLNIKNASNSINISLLDYFNNPGLTRNIVFNYSGGTDINISFDILNSSFSDGVWNTKWIPINNIANSISNSFLPSNSDILGHFVKTITINPSFSFDLLPSTFYWQLKNDTDTKLQQLLSLNSQVNSTYFPNVDFEYSISNLDDGQFNDEKGTVNITFEIKADSISKINNIIIPNFKTFNQMFPENKQTTGIPNNYIQLSTDSQNTYKKRFIDLLKEYLKNKTVSTDKNNPSLLTLKRPIIPSQSQGSTTSTLISEGQLKWSKENLNNFVDFKLLGQSFSTWNDSLHTLGASKQPKIGILNLIIENLPIQISVYKASTSYVIFTNLELHFSGFDLDKTIKVYYFASILNSEVQ